MSMDFTLDQLLTIIGRLDDSPGFDTPRERYRRFLDERLNDLAAARIIIQECREHSGEQSHRALQDAIVLCGRFLGFETAFGRYQHDPGAIPVHGIWQFRRRLRVTLILATDQTADINPETIAHAITEGEGGAPHIALIVVTPLYAAKERLEHTLTTRKYASVRLVTVRGVLRLCAMVVDGLLTQDDVLQVLHPAVTLDAQLDLLERVADAARRDSGSQASGETESHDRRYWVNAMRPEPLTPTDRIVTSLIATRQILGVNPEAGLADRVRPGDAICVFVAGRGIVAHAQIAGILADGSKIIRDSKRFTHVLRLTDVTVYDAPVVPSPEITRKLDLALAEDAAAVTMPISRREFESITAVALSQAG
jgi:hypothetical protein